MTTKSLPRDPTPEMVDAAVKASPFIARSEIVKALRAAHDAAPSSLPLKRTPAPTEPGWYWGRWKAPHPVKPIPRQVIQVEGDLIEIRGAGVCDAGLMEWFGPIPLPEVEP